jgi:hypothetical protein
MTKLCKDCKKELSLDQFGKNRYGIIGVCKSCLSLRRAKRRGEAGLPVVKGAEKLGFKVMTRSYVVCPHCKRIVGRAD